MKKILIICFVLALSTSCKKELLDKHSLTSINAGTFWKTEQDGKLGINGILDALQDRTMYSGTLNTYDGAAIPIFDGIGDNCYGNYKAEGPGNFMIANVDPSAPLFKGLWVSSYKGIARANLALESIPNIPSSAISDQSRKTLIAQALFLRSLFYSNLAVYYQDVPLILKLQNIGEAFVPKNTYQEVYDQIIKDLKTAANDLPPSYSTNEYGYPTKDAALGLLARMYLYNKDYQGVLDAISQISPRTLNPSYAQLFTEQGEFSNEILFSVRFFQDASNNGELFSGTFVGIPRVNVQPMPNLVKDYYCTDGKPITASPLYSPGTATNNTPQKNNRDPRLLASVYFNGDVFLTSPVTTFKGNTATTYGQKKYIRNAPSASGIAVFSPGGQDFIVLRYADILLMKAEALVELNQLGGVPALVNQVRARVNMPSVESVEGTNLSQGTLQNIVRHERRVELAFEGLRFFDLKRWGKMQDAVARAAADNVAGYTPIYRPGKSEIFAIPQVETQNNKNLIQNPVWQ
nr:RagB/SusD family nutrient uptake outer membrane protein [uncultured Pedobacter sp.]